MKNMRWYSLLAIFLLPIQGCQLQNQEPEELPNILWITSEDNSAYFLGCYGNSFATTPNLDKLATEGFLYTRAYANNPVCSPARNTILTGMYSASNGNEQMRSQYALPGIVRPYPEYLHEAGYYLTNNLKTDYNFDGDYNAFWDECSDEAHYRNRPEGKPFFAIFNLMTTHESSSFRQIPWDELKHDPEKVEIAPYHPDTPEMKHDWAQYYDTHQRMDAQVGALLKELEESGEADNTIVFYYGDHGGVLARSKRYVYETGTRVPFIIRIPEKYRHLFPAKEPGTQVDRQVSFVDLVPTLLSIIGTPVPEHLQGDAFLGKQQSEEPDHVFLSRQRMDERIDMVRAVRDKQYRYIRNYMPFRITMQHLEFLFLAPSAQSWEDAFYAGETNELQSRFFLEKPVEELYDTEQDPWEIHNLAEEPEYQEVLARMRETLTDRMREIRDVGLVPETEYAALAVNGSMYDYMHSSACPFEELLEAAQLATSAGPGDIQAYTGYLKHEHNAIRYWGAVGMLIHRENAGSAKETLEVATKDPSSAVAVMAAETLYRLGEKEHAVSAYGRILSDTVSYGMHDRNFALNSMDAAEVRSPLLEDRVTALYNSKKDVIKGFERFNNYDFLMSGYLLQKWGLMSPENPEFNISF